LKTYAQAREMSLKRLESVEAGTMILSICPSDGRLMIVRIGVRPSGKLANELDIVEKKGMYPF